MSASVLFGLLVGLAAIAAGGVTIVTAVLTRRRRAQIQTTYIKTGGVVYTVVQYGCAGTLMLAGLLVIVLVLVVRR